MSNGKAGRYNEHLVTGKRLENGIGKVGKGLVAVIQVYGVGGHGANEVAASSGKIVAAKG